MSPRQHSALVVALATLVVVSVVPAAHAGDGQGASGRRATPSGKRATTNRLKVSVAPLEPKHAKYSHAPYDAGECELCHERGDKKDPGDLISSINELCAECHDDMLAQGYKHQPAARACTSCHNPHNARQPKLLVTKLGTLCFTCHTEIAQIVTESTVKHGALEQGRKCMNCHEPHSTDVEHLLRQLPYDMCISCHSSDDLVDDQGRKLTNFKALLDDNPVRHAPVAAKDCSACHRPHGSDHFRLLDSEYPAQFYAPWTAKNYDICFQCHDQQAFEQKRTVTLTQFRDGARNLHFVHVHRDDRGRTCRACHEVHAAKQAGNIRDGVPYGKKGWLLKLNYERSDTGGSCQKTCHHKQTYKNSAGRPRQHDE